MRGIARAQSGIYFVIDSVWGIHILASGTLKQCREYCKKHNIPTKILWDW